MAAKQTTTIVVESQPGPERLNDLGVFNWSPLLRRKSGENPRRFPPQGNAHQDTTKPAVTGIPQSIWTKEISEFPWTYDESETCYFLEGDVIVTPDGGEPVNMGKGDLVTFPAGMSCIWKINSNVKKHYYFG